MEKISKKEYQQFNEEHFMKKILFRHGQSVVFTLSFRPGQQLPPHRHPGSHLYLTVLEGGGTLTIDGSDTDIVKGDAVHCEGEEEFSFHNTGAESAVLYVMLNDIPDERYAQNI
ncbi:cupin domain-containing protein [Paenibacillus medicaginis]|uniref:Cupin domain-containing protein n=1 Tax=Paenibacillus medicaginis TaxID=1470560 RepID=A0ABV5BUL6_9BACL